MQDLVSLSETFIYQVNSSLEVIFNHFYVLVHYSIVPFKVPFKKLKFSLKRVAKQTWDRPSKSQRRMTVCRGVWYIIEAHVTGTEAHTSIQRCQPLFKRCQSLVETPRGAILWAIQVHASTVRYAPLRPRKLDHRHKKYKKTVIFSKIQHQNTKHHTYYFKTLTNT